MGGLDTSDFIVLVYFCVICFFLIEFGILLHHLINYIKIKTTIAKIELSKITQDR